MISLEGREIVGLYLFLKERDMDLDDTLERVLYKTERLLYNKLSVDELERLSDLYQNKKDILRERG